jgi:hypothetical protein
VKFSDQFKNALLVMVQQYSDPGAVEVLDFEEETVEGGYCSTCAYTETVVDVEYRRQAGHRRTWRYSGGFADLIRDLDGFTE